MNADGTGVRQLTKAPGCYNGGPFFSPDGKRVIFRSDRKSKDQLQLYVINTDGTGERALTDDQSWVQWGRTGIRTTNISFMPLPIMPPREGPITTCIGWRSLRERKLVLRMLREPTCCLFSALTANSCCGQATAMGANHLSYGSPIS